MIINETNNIYASSAQSKMQSPLMRDVKGDTSLQNAYSNLQKGTFDVIIYDNAGTQIAKTITVDSTTTMSNDTFSKSILTQINTSTDDNADNNSLNEMGR